MRPRAQTCLESLILRSREAASRRMGNNPPFETHAAHAPQGEAAGKAELFDNLSEKLGGILDRLTRRGALNEADVDAAMREVRRALLEADVSLDVVRSFTERVREQAVGATVVKSVKPGQMVVKIVHDELVATLGA